MAEWSKALVLGTNHICGVGSNPTAAKFFFFLPALFSYSVESPVYSTLPPPRSNDTSGLCVSNHSLVFSESYRRCTKIYTRE